MSATGWTNVLGAVCVAAFMGTLMSALPARADDTPDPLLSWNDGALKANILDYVARVTTEGSPDFVPKPDRIATFDNDGTLWVEKPLYTLYALVFFALWGFMVLLLLADYAGQGLRMMTFFGSPHFLRTSSAVLTPGVTPLKLATSTAALSGGPSGIGVSR